MSSFFKFDGVVGSACVAQNVSHDNDPIVFFDDTPFYFILPQISSFYCARTAYGKERIGDTSIRKYIP